MPRKRFLRTIGTWSRGGPTGSWVATSVTRPKGIPKKTFWRRTGNGTVFAASASVSTRIIVLGTQRHDRDASEDGEGQHQHRHANEIDLRTADPVVLAIRQEQRIDQRTS